MSLDINKANQLRGQAQRGHRKSIGDLFQLLMDELNPLLSYVTLTVTTSLFPRIHAGKNLIMSLAGGARTYTLPASTGSGDKYRFTVGIVNTSNYIVKVANSSDVIQGNVLFETDDASNVPQTFTTVAASDTVTLNGTTTGGVSKGDWFEVQDVAANLWVITGILSASGTEATPFSATV